MQNLTKHYSYSESDPSQVPVSQHQVLPSKQSKQVPVSQHQVLPSKQSKLRAIPMYFLKFYCPIGQDIIAKHYVDTAAIIRS